MPQFALDALDDDTVDPSEVSQTSEMPASGRRRIVVRKKQPTIPPPLPSTEEVALEDILLEAYIEQPQRATRPVSHSRADDREVDALLMMTPSVAPVAMSTPPPPVAPPIKQSSGGLLAIALLVVAVASGFGAMLVAPHLKDVKHAASATNASAPRAVTVIAAKTAQPEAVSVDALPPSTVEPTMTLVTFPKSAAGHRVYVDETLIGSGEQRAKIRCGKHTIKIGSQGKPREIDLACGRELTLD